MWAWPVLGDIYDVRRRHDLVPVGADLRWKYNAYLESKLITQVYII